MSEDKVMSSLKKVRNMLPSPKDMLPDLKKTVAFVAFCMCVNSLSAKTVTGRVIELDGANTYLQTDEGKMKIESGNLVRAITAVNQKRGEVGLVKLDIDDNTSEVRGGLVYPTGVRVSSGVGNIIYDIGSWVDDAQKLSRDVGSGNIRRVFGDVTDATVNASPERVVAEPGSCAKVIGYRIVDGKTQTGYMPIHKRGADGYYMENGGASQSTSYSGGNSYSQPTKSVHINQLTKASNNTSSGGGMTFVSSYSRR